MEQINIDRINVLYKKSKNEGLTEEELEEQKQLRKEYIEAFKNNLKGTLESIVFVDEIDKKPKE